MKYTLLAIALLGCAPALSPRDVCLNACETRGDECRAECPSIARETVVGVEYAASVSSLSTLWTCEAGMAFFVRSVPEVIRARGFGRDESAARTDAIQHALAIYADFKNMNHVTVDDITPNAQAFVDAKKRFNWVSQRCWKSDQDPHPDLANWPAATWPRPRVTIKDMTNGKPMSVPAGLVWDPNKTNAVKIAEAGSAFTCRGAVYFRIRIGDDLTGVQEIVDERSGLSGSDSSAYSELRNLLIARARAKAVELCGDSDKMLLDTMGGALDATPIKCWQGIKRAAPVDWRGPTMW